VGTNINGNRPKTPPGARLVCCKKKNETGAVGEWKGGGGLGGFVGGRKGGATSLKTRG